MSASDPITPTPRRFSIRLPRPMWIGVAAVVLIVVAISLRIGVPIWRQRAAIREIERLGGIVTTEPTGPQWLRDLAGTELMGLFDKADWVQLGDKHATDATLRQISILTSTRTLWLEGTQVTDRGLDDLKGLNNLRYLRLNNTQVTDAGLVSLKELKNLEAISLDHTQITDVGLAHLQQLPNLHLFWLSDTRATNAGVADLKRAIPNSEIVVDRALAAPADPPILQSEIIRFRFRHGPARAQTGQEFQELPETECGEMLFERMTGRCVYRYWYDGVHETPLRFRSDAGDPPDEDWSPRDRVRKPLKGAAAFDGKRYWAAFYKGGRFDRRYANSIVVYQDDDDLHRRDGIGRMWVNLPTWYHWAPLHNLTATVGSPAMERVEFHRAIKSSPGVQRLGPHAFSVKVGRSWEYVVSLDNSDLGIGRVAVRYAGGFTGHYPPPMPMDYSMECENAEDMDSEQLDELTNPDLYADDSTVFID